MKFLHKTMTKSAVALTAIVLSITSCQQKMETPQEDNDKIIEIKCGSEKKDSVHIHIEPPTLPDKAVNAAIMEQLSEALGGSYQGDYNDVDSFAHHYLTYYLQEMKTMHADDTEMYDEDMEFMMQYERDLTIGKEYETDRLITFSVQFYQYNGGAHGLTTSYGLTFRKSDGRQMGKNVLNNEHGDEEWTQMMRKGLMEYFEVDTEEELSESLFNNDLFELNLPEAEPYFTEQGLTFIYQQYEIAAYACGMPSFVIPYNRLSKYLNETGKRLVENRN